MPLRDHFRPPISASHSWEGFHATWPAMLVQRMYTLLPPGYSAEPRVRLGTYYEVDVGGHRNDTPVPRPVPVAGNGGVATLPWTIPQPTATLDVDIGSLYEYEVQIYDPSRARRLVAAIEFVSPGNKDRPEHRNAFLAKWAALLQKGVCVAVVDPVTARDANLYAELLKYLHQFDPALGAEPPGTYAVTCRPWKVNNKPRLDAWVYTLTVGEPLPALPLWLAEDVVIRLDLEGSYEDTCRILQIV